MFHVTVGVAGLVNSQQDPFPRTVECCHCWAQADIGFVATEYQAPGAVQLDHVASLHPNDPDGEGVWLHDLCAVAVYFCRSCLEPTALYNQA